MHFRLHTNYFLLPWKIPKKLAVDQCSSITKSSIYILNMSIRPFTTRVDGPEIGHLGLIEVSIMFYICTYCVFILFSRIGKKLLSVAQIWTNLPKPTIATQMQHVVAVRSIACCTCHIYARFLWPIQQTATPLIPHMAVYSEIHYFGSDFHARCNGFHTGYR